MLDLLISNANAADVSQQSGFISLLPLLVLFAAFWFFLIRPQMRRAKEHKEMIDAINKGDEIVTVGGLLGKIKEVSDDFIMLEVAKELQVKVQKQAISLIVPKGTIKTLENR